MRSDSELLSEFRASRSESAFAEIVARHGGSVFQACLRVTGRRDEAEDAAQATFLMLSRRPASVRRSLAGWLHWMAFRMAWSVLRGRIHRERHEEGAARLKEDPAMRTGDAVDAEDLRRQLDAALERLPESLREALVLRYLEGRSQEEAAAIAGCPQGTLGWRATEGLNRLRAVVGRRGTLVGTALLLGLLAKEATAASATTLAVPALAAGGTGSAAVLANQVAHALMWFKIKAAAGTVAAAAVLSVAPIVLLDRAPQLGSEAGTVSCVAFSADGANVATGGRDGAIRIWDRTTGRQRGLLGEHEGEVTRLAFSPDGRLLASSGADHTARLWDIERSRPLALLPSLPLGVAVVSSVAFSPDGNLLCVAVHDMERPIRIHDARTGSLRTVLGPYPDPVIHEAVFSPAGTEIASVGRDSQVRLWDLRTGKERAGAPLGVAHGVCVAFSPDGTQIATGGGGGGQNEYLQRWDLPDLRPRGTLEGHARDVSAIAFSPDGKTFASGDLGGTIKLWEARSNRSTRTIEGARGSVFSLVFSPDGRTLASVHAEQGLAFWPLED